jgi:hypothetical protein
MVERAESTIYSTSTAELLVQLNPKIPFVLTDQFASRVPTILWGSFDFSGPRTLFSF